MFHAFYSEHIWTWSIIKGALAEWLRRSPAKAVCYACVSSNLTGVETILFASFYLQF